MIGGIVAHCLRAVLRSLRLAALMGGVACMVACSGASPGGSADASVLADAAPDVGVDAAADCHALQQALVVAFEAAVLCDPSSTAPQCTGAVLMRNQCGCEWAANDQAPAESAAAQAAWNDLVGAGCLPPPGCGPCAVVLPSFRCAPLPMGTQGTCEIDPG